MFEHRDPTGRLFKTYEVDADDFNLYQGDRVAEGFEIGMDIHSGDTIYLNFNGYVATVYYNPMNHSYLVMICLLREEQSEMIETEDDNSLVAVS